jgi:hypothetical protein
VPPTPREVTATLGLQRIELKWSPSGAYTAHGYEVSRATARGGPFTSIYSTKRWTTPYYVDTAVEPGVTYYYTIAALSKALTEAKDIEQLFAIWERNVDTVRAINRQTNRSTPRGVIAQNLVAHLKSRAIALAKQGTEPATNLPQSQSGQSRPKIDKSILTLSEPKRIRSKDHLRFVAQQPCVICGRTPAHAHHIRYAQPRGIALKVSDEFTVPLCAIHHRENHTTGDERRWWQERKIDPLVVAQELWKATTGVENPAG